MHIKRVAYHIFMAKVQDASKLTIILFKMPAKAYSDFFALECIKVLTIMHYGA